MLGGDTARTAEPNWALPHCVVLRDKTGGERLGVNPPRRCSQNVEEERAIPSIQHIHLPGTSSVSAEGLSGTRLLCVPWVWLDEEESETLVREREELL